MLFEIYKAMLTAAKGWPVPPNIELGFTFNEEETQKFWATKNGEPEMLLEEWENPCTGRYEKVLYGKKFFIQFTYKKQA